MKRIRFIGVVLVLASAGHAATLRAQIAHVGLGGGPIIPMSMYGKNDQLGWHALAYGEVSLPVPSVSFRVAAMYSQSPHKGGLGGHSKLGGAVGDLVWHAPLPKPPVRLDLLGGIGYYNMRVEAMGLGSVSESRVAFDGGVGMSASLGGARFFGEAGLISVRTSGDPTTFTRISAGVSFTLR